MTRYAIQAVPDGVTYIVEVQELGPGASTTIQQIDGVPGRSPEEAIEWVLTHLKEQYGAQNVTYKSSDSE